MTAFDNLKQFVFQHKPHLTQIHSFKPLNRKCFVDTSSGDDKDPLKYYYKPFFGYIYRKRLSMCLKAIGRKKFDNLLEMGYGSGIFLPRLSKISANLSGLDIHKMHREVMKSMKQIGIGCALASGDILNPPYADNTFDGIVLISILEHIHQLDTAIRQIQRVLKAKGRIYVGIPVRNKLTDIFFQKICRIGKSTAVMHVSSHRDIFDAIKSKFEIERIITFPRFFPMDLAFYILIEAKKQ